MSSSVASALAHAPTMRTPAPRVPPELIYKIVLFAAAAYIDDLIAGPLSIPHLGGPALGNGFLFEQNLDDHEHEHDAHHGHDDHDSDTAARWLARLRKAETSDPAQRAPNPLRPLLAASYQLRALTLRALGHLLGVRMVRGADGLTHLTPDPWTTRIHPTRLAYLNAPVLAYLATHAHDAPQLQPTPASTQPHPAHLHALAEAAAAASPLLHAYQVVGRAEAVLVAPQTYGGEDGMRWARRVLVGVRGEVRRCRCECRCTPECQGRASIDYKSDEESIEDREEAEQEEDDEEWACCVAWRVRRCDERSYAITLFTLSTTLLRTTLLALRRAGAMLASEGSADPLHAADAYTAAVARMYDEGVARLGRDVAVWGAVARGGVSYAPSEKEDADTDAGEASSEVDSKASALRVPAYIRAEDIESARAVFAEIVDMRVHPFEGARYAECREAARMIAEGLAVCLQQAQARERGRVCV